jgi:hypothetical protein
LEVVIPRLRNLEHAQPLGLGKIGVSEWLVFSWILDCSSSKCRSKDSRRSVPYSLFELILSRLLGVVRSAHLSFHVLLDLLNLLRDRRDNRVLYLRFSDHQSQR